MNNFEKIKAMNIDEMTEFFIKHKLSCRSVIRDNTAPCPLSSDICTPEKCYKQWLESEVKEMTLFDKIKETNIYKFAKRLYTFLLEPVLTEDIIKHQLESEVRE